jgi:Dynamin family/Dynamin central region/Dynamin GTPase effector domain
MTDNTSSLRTTVDTLSSIGRTLTSFGSTAVTAVSYIASTTEVGQGLEQMSHGKLIELADLVHDVFQGDTLLEPPSICTIGGQSAGKSMALNSLCGLDILPNGKSIVTRTPIHLRLLHDGSLDHIRVEFFEYASHITVGGTDSVHKILAKFKVDLECPQDQLYPIREEIEKITERYAGKSKNVVDRPINIRITSPKVPNLSIIDLPGLTHIALRDKGQPANIKENIEQMLTRYISSPRTIILAIIPATSDVEADMGLGLIKQYDPDFERTIGVLTKTDLLVDSDVERYLTNSISRDLQVKYGYYAVRNRSSDEVKSYTVEEGYGLESQFFASHPRYSKSDAKERMGSINLANRLSEVLISHLKACLPSVIEEIRKFDKNLESKLDEIGRDYPQDAEAKRSVMNVLLSEFQKTYDQSVTGRGAEYNTGAQIKRAVNNMKTNCTSLNPFTPGIYTNEKIQEIIEDYDGIHMSSSAISTGVIEALFQGTGDPHPFFHKSASANALTHPSLGNYRRNTSRSSSNSAEPKASKSKKNKVKSEDEDDGFMGMGFGMDSDTDDDVNDTFMDSSIYEVDDDYTDMDVDVRRCDPLTVLIDPYRTCMKSIQRHLIDLAADILTRERFSRFPKLCNRVRDIVSNSIVPKRYQEVIADIEKRILAEKRCVWTDNADFNTRILPSVINGSSSSSRGGKKKQKQELNLAGEMPINPDAIRRVLYEYFKIVKGDLMTYMHKQIIAFFVKEVVDDVNTGLNDKILEKSTIDVLLEENKDKAAKRAELYALKQKINMIKGMINDMQ